MKLAVYTQWLDTRKWYVHPQRLDTAAERHFDVWVRLGRLVIMLSGTVRVGDFRREHGM